MLVGSPGDLFRHMKQGWGFRSNGMTYYHSVLQGLLCRHHELLGAK